MKFLPIGAILLTACVGTTRDAKRSQNRLDLAKDLLVKGELAGAETETKRAIALDRENEEAHNVLGLVYVMRAQGSTALIERTGCLTGADADALRQQADAEMRAAAKHFARATELAPDYGEAWSNRAVVSMYFHEWERAVEHAKRALAELARLESPPLARANLGWAYFHRQNYVRAVTELLQANQGPQYFCLGSYRLAAVYFARKEYEQAARRLGPMLDDPRMCPPIQEAAYLGGQTYLRLRDHQRAAGAFDRCVEMAPNSCQARDCRKALAELTR